MEKNCKCLGKTDVIVINGGANDISSIRTHMISAVGKMAHTVQKYNNTNIIIVNIPHRYDLNKTSVINSEIHTFNKQLLKLRQGRATEGNHILLAFYISITVLVLSLTHVTIEWYLSY